MVQPRLRGRAARAYLRMLWRQSAMINVGGKKVYPAEVETVLMQMGNVGDATVYGERKSMMGRIVTAKIALGQSEALDHFNDRLRA